MTSRTSTHHGNYLLDRFIEAQGSLGSPDIHGLQLMHGSDPFDALPSRDFIIFPTTAVVAAQTTMPDGWISGVSVIGRDGSFGMASFAHPAPVRYRYRTVQPGDAIAIRWEDLEPLYQSPRIAPILLDYLNYVAQELSVQAYCISRHAAEARTARWLLAVRARSPLPVVHVTHEMLGDCLSLKREVVAGALTRLATLGAIEPQRGRIAISNPRALRDSCCTCHEVDRLWEMKWDAKILVEREGLEPSTPAL